ncbi:MAG: 2-C-methyl-D-erythritol 2,4-cyclodiphosphate synthase [Rubellimicrobium sp.]|nr:2-C-methyl-D-erythritol 2,4-cyclodiphosphate synthase [Rubellimicrobium sp.]
MRIATIITAAGRGTRAGDGPPKQWRMLGDRRVLDRTIAAFVPFGPVVAVLHPDDMALLPARAGLAVCPGGASRAASVAAGLEALAGDPPDIVLIHDGARPLVTSALIARVIEGAAAHGAAAPALAVTDALWRGGGQVEGAVDRSGLWRAQTPQGFRFDAILAAHRAHAGDAADDVAVARAAGIAVAIVPGEDDNLKITGPGDFARAGRILGERIGESRMDIRTGNGFDVHRFGPGDHVMLCGVRVPHGAALAGHSDADVGMHALTDAIYGALAEGDIGRHFPPSDLQWKAAASAIFLGHAVARVQARGFTITSADVTLICEEPKIAPHADAMAAELARTLGIEDSCVNVKGTTSERLGFTGRGEGIAALATVTLVAP